MTGLEHPPTQDVQQPGSSSEEAQVEGEPGIGGIEARSRKPMSKIVFHEKVS